MGMLFSGHQRGVEGAWELVQLQRFMVSRCEVGGATESVAETSSIEIVRPVLVE